MEIPKGFVVKDGVLNKAHPRQAWYTPQPQVGPVLEVPEGVRSIADYAFRDQEGLEEVHLPSTLEHIGNSAFLRCRRLKMVTGSESIRRLGDDAFNGCGLTAIDLPNIETMGSRAFKDCAELADIQIGSRIEAIESGTFKGCKKLHRIVLPKGVNLPRMNSWASCPIKMSIVIRDSRSKDLPSAITGRSFSPGVKRTFHPL